MSNEKLTQIEESSKEMSDVLEELHNSIVSGAFEHAHRLTRSLNPGPNQIIKDTVNRLLDNTNANVVAFGYRLWLANQQELVIANFPPEFKLMYNGDEVTITDNNFGLPLKMNDVKEYYGDRKVYGDGRKMVHDASRWTFSPVWENDNVYFKILNVQYKQWLKLVMKAEDRGDRRAFGSDDSDTKRHQWYIHPVKLNEKLLFYFFNREYDMALYLGDWLAPNNDRIAWGYNGRALGRPAVFGWKINYE